MRRLVLAGLGHAHLFVLEAIARGAFPPCEVHVCTGEAEHVYSGMVPGWLGGRYRREEISLDVSRLCAAAGATWHRQHVRALDAAARTVTLADGTTVPFDIASVAVGSVPAGLDKPGVRAHAIPLKPLGEVERIAERVDALRASADEHRWVSVVGGGLAGVEIALAIRARLQAAHAGGSRSTSGVEAGVSVRIITRDAALAAGAGGSLSQRLARECGTLGVAVETGMELREVTADTVRMADARTLPSALTVWATGPAAPQWLATSGCTVDERGFLLVNSALRSVSHPHVFAAGDCAALQPEPGMPKAGVYAVRMGPVLATALAAALAGATVRERFTPQRRWLALVNLGDGRAIARYGPLVVAGGWAMRWKDAIDRRFVARFSGEPSEADGP